MRRPIVAANWKMHGSLALIDVFAESMAHYDTLEEDTLEEAVEIVVIPPVVFLAQAVARLRGVEFGVQNVHTEATGAFTGEIGAQMAAEVGATYALVGHSERRQIFGETDEVVGAKYRAARRAGLVPIVCVGETLEQRRAGNHKDVVLSQLRAALDGSDTSPDDTVIAYEPVWAIGTGETASPAQAQTMHALLRGAIGDPDIRILYGGSVKPENAEALFAQEDIDGGLVGGASLDPVSFNAISAVYRTGH